MVVEVLQQAKLLTTDVAAVLSFLVALLHVRQHLCMEIIPFRAILADELAQIHLSYQMSIQRMLAHVCLIAMIAFEGFQTGMHAFVHHQRPLME